MELANKQAIAIDFVGNDIIKMGILDGVKQQLKLPNSEGGFNIIQTFQWNRTREGQILGRTDYVYLFQKKDMSNSSCLAQPRVC